MTITYEVIEINVGEPDVVTSFDTIEEALKQNLEDRNGKIVKVYTHASGRTEELEIYRRAAVQSGVKSEEKEAGAFTKFFYGWASIMPDTYKSVIDYEKIIGNRGGSWSGIWDWKVSGQVMSTRRIGDAIVQDDGDAVL